VVVDLPAAYADIRAASAHTSWQDCKGLSGVLARIVDGRTKVALERESRLSLALALKVLPTDVCSGPRLRWPVPSVNRLRS
jgi:hypothetical protein